MPLTFIQRKKLEVLKAFMTSKEKATVKFLVELFEKTDAMGEEIEKRYDDLKELIEEIQNQDPVEIRGDDGDPGADGEDYVLTKEDKKEIAAMIKVPIVKKETIREKTIIVEKMPIVTENVREVAVGPTIEELRDGLEALPEDEQLDWTAIRGLKKALLDRGASKVRLVGGTNGIILYVNGKKQGIVKFLTLTAGPGITLTPVVNNNSTVVTITGASISSSELPATGSVDGGNKIFTFTKIPSYIVSDGAWYKQKDNQSPQQTNWSVTGSSSPFTVTMVIPPQSSIFGIA